MSSRAPYDYPGQHHHLAGTHRPLQPEQVSGYTSLAQWHGGQPLPVYPPRGDPAPPPQPPAQQPPPASVPPHTPNGDRRIPGPPSRGATRSPTRWLRDDGPTIDPSTHKWTCVCGTSFTTPRDREQHWRTFKCDGAGSSQTYARPADTFVIPARYAGQIPHEVDKKWLSVLLKTFEDNTYPSKETRTELAWKMKVPRYAVDAWYGLLAPHNPYASSEGG